MSDHADVFASWENWEGGVCCSEAGEIMDTLVAERDEARRERDKALLSVEGLSKRLTIAVAAEAEVARLREALTYHQCEGPELPCPVCAALAAPTKEGGT